MEDGEALFLGTHKMRIDPKGRMSFPAQFRDVLTERKTRAFLFQSFNDNAIEGWTYTYRDEFRANLRVDSQFDEQRRDIEQALFADAKDIAFDKDGRFIIDKDLFALVGISDEAEFLGCGEYFQVWNPATLAARNAARNTPEARAARLAFLKQRKPPA